MASSPITEMRSKDKVPGPSNSTVSVALETVLFARSIVRGLAIPQIRGFVVESLMTRSYDEAFTVYGLLARSVETGRKVIASGPWPPYAFAPGLGDPS